MRFDCIHCRKATTKPQSVKGAFLRMLTILSDLGLQPNSLPLLVGELVSEGQGGACASMNPVIQKLPETIPVVHVVSSEGCEAVSDRLHFSAAGYRELGKRYALTMLELLKKSK